MLIKLEYIWLDGYQPESNLRSKTKIWDFEHKFPKYNTLEKMVRVRKNYLYGLLMVLLHYKQKVIIRIVY